MVESGPSSKRFKMASGGEGGTHVGFIGGGNLARAITEGLLQAGGTSTEIKLNLGNLNMYYIYILEIVIKTENSLLFIFGKIWPKSLYYSTGTLTRFWSNFKNS